MDGGLTFDEVYRGNSWRPIPGCPGRWVLRGGSTDRSVENLAGEGVRVVTVKSAGAEDPVYHAPLPGGGGIISYRKPDGRFVHTLCTAEGYARKLAMLGFPAPGTPPENDPGENG